MVAAQLPDIHGLNLATPPVSLTNSRVRAGLTLGS
jgi:hypothetical protein